MEKQIRDKQLGERNEQFEQYGDSHIISSLETPLVKDVFNRTDEQKMDLIESLFHQIMEVVGLDMTDDSLMGTPRRFSKMLIKELFCGLKPENKPNPSTFDNKYKYNQMLVEKDIILYSTCEHHFLPIVGRAHIGYISSGRVIGLSKINRIVNYYSKRPQVQERLTMQIVNELQTALNTEDVACVIDAKHLCVNSRGIKDIDSSTITAELGGHFKNNPTTRREFLHYIGVSSKIHA